jgi:WD40 repeat protein
MSRTSKVLLLTLGLVAFSFQPSRADEQSKTPEAKKPRTDRYADPLPEGALLRIGTSRFRHGDEIRELVFSPDGKILASRGCKRFRFWEARSGKRIFQELERFTEWGRVAFSPDSRSVAIAEDDGTVSIHAIDKPRQAQRLSGQKEGILHVTYSPDGKRLAAVGWDLTLVVWDLATGKRLLRTRHATKSKRLTCEIVLTSDDKLVACIDEQTDFPKWRSKSVCAWDIRTGRAVAEFELPKPDVHFAAFTADGKTLFCGGDGSLTAWQATPPKVLRSVRQEQPGFDALALSPDGKRIASAGSRSVIQIWDVETLKVLKKWSGEGYSVSALAFSPDGKTLASAENGIIRLWDTRTGKRVDPFEGQEDGIASLAFVQGGKQVVVAAGSTIRLLDATTGKLVRAFKDEAAVGKHIALSADERLLAAADEGIAVWELATGKLVHRAMIQSSWVCALAFGKDNRLTSAGSRLTEVNATVDWIRHWDASGEKKVRRLCLAKDKNDSRYFRALSPDGQMLLSSRYWASCPPLQLWDPVTGRQLSQFGEDFTGLCLIDFSPDGKMLATGSDGPLVLWEVRTGLERRSCRRQEEEFASRRAFSPNGRMLAEADYHGDIRVRDLASDKVLVHLTGHDRIVTCLAFSPDGKRLASGSEDTTVLVWDLTDSIKRAPPLRSRPAKTLDALWKELADPNGAKAYDALWGLVAVPKDAVSLLQKSLRPVASPDERVKELIAKLASEKFAVRQKAAEELKAMGELAWPALEELLKGNPDAEVRRRAERLLNGPLPALTQDQLRALRAIEVLDLIGTAEAREVLKILAGGAPCARLTQDAKAVLARMAKRSAVKP